MVAININNVAFFTVGPLFNVLQLSVYSLPNSRHPIRLWNNKIAFIQNSIGPKFYCIVLKLYILFSYSCWN